MKVIEALSQGRPTLSFEFFPPRDAEQETNLYRVISELKDFQPDFVSVTYGAMGRTKSQTFFWAKKIKSEFGIEPVPHLTCVAATKQSIGEQLDELISLGMENLLALRGDPPEEQQDFVPPADGFRHAAELVGLIKKLQPPLCVGVAGYPEKHPQAPDFKTDILHLKEKVEAGAEYVTTQLFFNNQTYLDFVERCRTAGLTVPIIPGLMPITSVKQLKRMTGVIGAKIPAALLSKLEKYESDPKSIQAIGVEQAVNQCQELLSHKVPGLHFFVLNQSGPISQILKELKAYRR